MAYLVDVSRKARAAVRETLDWKREHSPAHADTWYVGLLAALQSLEDYPKRCPLAPENEFVAEEVRQLLYGKRPDVYRILFVIRGVTVSVLAIRHAAQQTLTALTEDDESDGDE